jgi:hypothetical protein
LRGRLSVKMRVRPEKRINGDIATEVS